MPFATTIRPTLLSASAVSRSGIDATFTERPVVFGVSGDFGAVGVAVATGFAADHGFESGVGPGDGVIDGAGEPMADGPVVAVEVASAPTGSLADAESADVDGDAVGLATASAPGASLTEPFVRPSVGTALARTPSTRIAATRMVLERPTGIG